LHYLCLVYGELAETEDTSRGELDALLSELQSSGRLVTIWGPNLAGSTARVSVRAGEVRVESVSSDLFGVAVLNARDLNEAIRTASRFPQARAGQVDIHPVTS
jgi:hypothetical protein